LRALPRPSAEGPIKVSAGDKKTAGTVAQAQITFEEALESVKPSIAGFVALIDSLAKKPDNVELSFGLKVAGEIGLFTIAKASGEANYTLKLTWKP
jgi:NTP-dependent ternary system trypsin peptidase co-occuring protein